MSKDLAVSLYLRDNSFEKLKEEYGIKISDYKDYVVLNYQDGVSPKYHEIIKECRALILDKNTLNPLSRALDRFYNLNDFLENVEDPNNPFVMSNCVCYEKIDGSLISLFYNKYTNRWEFSTRSMAHAEGPTNGLPVEETFKDVIKRAFLNKIPIRTNAKLSDSDFDNITEQTLKYLSKDNTYVLELTSPRTRVTKPYENEDLYYLSHRNISTGEEYIDYDYVTSKCAYSVFKNPEIYYFTDIDDIVKAIEKLPALDEGYICVWKDKLIPNKLHRVKVKNPAHMAIANMKCNGVFSERRICYLILAGSVNTYLEHWPEDLPLIEEFINTKTFMENTIPDIINFLKSGDFTKKDMAIYIMNEYPEYKGLLFNMLKGMSMEDGFKHIKNSSKEGAEVCLKSSIKYEKRILRKRLIDVLQKNAGDKICSCTYGCSKEKSIEPQ